MAGVFCFRDNEKMKIMSSKQLKIQFAFDDNELKNIPFEIKSINYMLRMILYSMKSLKSHKLN